jgi:hypothetical protein
MSEKFLTRLYYASTATEKYSPMEIGNILEACRKNNPPLDVTGMLFLGNRYFLQCLEGPREGLNILYQKLIHDERHTNVQLLEVKEVGSRYFDEWSMKYLGSMTVITKILRSSGMKEFNPYLLDSYTINAVMEVFRDYNEPEVTDAGVKRKKSFMGLFSR